MSLCNLCFVVTLATVVAFAGVGSVNRRALKGETRLTSLLPFQSTDTKSLGVGKLLVASRSLGDPNFAETVILLVHYETRGVLGLVLNRRTELPLSRVLKDLKAAKDRSDPVYLGGPVDTPTVFALYQSPAKIEGADHVFDKVYLISAKPVFEQTMSARPNPNIFHVYLGYAGWNTDQLQREVELGSWFIFPADASTVFSSDPDSLWPQMIRKTELQFAGSTCLVVHQRRMRSYRKRLESTLSSNLGCPAEAFPIKASDDATTDWSISNGISDHDSPLWLGRDRRVLQQHRGEVHRVSGFRTMQSNQVP